MADIAERGRHAILVGGTGLYLRAVVDDLQIPGRYAEVAAALNAELDEGRADVSDLHARLVTLDPVAASRMDRPTGRGSPRPGGDYRRRAALLRVRTGARGVPGVGIPMVGIAVEQAEVDRRIAARFAAWLEAGLLQEVQTLAARPAGLSRTARQALGYRELLAHVEDGVPLEGCVTEAVRRTGSFARRQTAWFRRDPPYCLDSAGGQPHFPAGRRAGGARPVHMTCENGAVHCTKHEGTGNDFIVVVDPDDRIRLSEGQARLLCDRRRGIGGTASSSSAPVVMAATSPWCCATPTVAWPK